MIYLIIADIQSLEKDCRDTRQSCSLFSKDLKKYIKNTKNEKTKNERFLAYSSLLYSLKEFFSVDNPKIEKNKNGKPSLSDGSVYISISHCDDVAAVALSDEGEIGVDIQSEIDATKSYRLEKRFLSEIRTKNDFLNVKYLYLKTEFQNPVFTEIYPTVNNDNDFLSKWTLAESVIKCRGEDFSAISKINELSENLNCRIADIYNGGKKYRVALSIAKLKA